MSRYTHAQSILGAEAHAKIETLPILIVGAGGIGSELLKNLVLIGFSNITIVDLDTIDLSNLNRQFLFRKPDISKPKALVAAATAKQFNPHVNIDARHSNIKDQEFDVNWVKKFALVFGALDNLDARRHVNKLCISAGVPLMESGTAGYLGQVRPIIKDVTECYACVAKPVPTTFPVCTIRSTPSTPIHCIVWAKSYLFVQLFGEDDEGTDGAELEKAKEAGENAAEIENLKKEASAFREVKKNLSESDGPQKVFEKVFQADINRLLSMADMWTVPGRIKPTPLLYDSILEDAFELPEATSKKAKDAAAAAATSAAAKAGGAGAGLKDQKLLSLKENVELFRESCKRLAARVVADPSTPLSFDKDDDDTLDFVTATSNLRSFAYGIEPQTRFKIKEMAGNIIPAIATTNAIIAGAIAFRAVQILSQNPLGLNDVYLQGRTGSPLVTLKVQGPLPSCGVCRDVYIPVACDPKRVTLGELLKEVVRAPRAKEGETGGGLGYGEGAKLSVYESGRLLVEPVYDDEDEEEGGLNNEGRTLEDLGCGVGKWLTVVDEEDEEEKHATVSFAICNLIPSSSSSSSSSDPSTSTASPSYILSYPLPQVPMRPQPVPPPASPEPEIEATSSKKRSFDEVEEIDGPVAKKTKVEGEKSGTIEIEDSGKDEIDVDAF